MENLIEIIRPMGSVLKVLSISNIDNMQMLATASGYTDYACWAITNIFKQYGLVEESTPFKLTMKGVEVLNQL